MVTIRIEECAQNAFNAIVSIDGSGEHPIKIADPFSPEEEARLEWYFEEHLRFPFTDQVKAREAGESIKTYGETLFNQVFADRDAFAEYKTAARQGLDQLCLEILGSAEFHRLHWEALKDPDLPKPLCLYAPMVRRSRKPQIHPAGMVPSPTINLLIVTARPHVERDVGYRTITRPLVEALRAARLPVDIAIIRPGTYRALSEHLQHKGAGFYHVVHFDLHGALLSHEKLQKAGQAEQLVFQARYGRPELPAYDGEKAFLFFEDEFFEDESAPHSDATEPRADPAEASDVAERLLLPYRIPIIILVTLDAMGCQKAIASRILEQGADYLLVLKANHGTAFLAVQECCDQHCFARGARAKPVFDAFDDSHGRLVRRRVFVCPEGADLEALHAWPGLRTVLAVETIRGVNGSGTVEAEIRYFLSSCPDDPAVLIQAIRRHWTIENGLHWVLDVTFREDDSRVRNRIAARNLAILRKIAINLMGRDRTPRISMRARRKQAAWNDDYMLALLAG